MQQKAVSFISEQEYLDFEKDSETKNEYFDGEIFAMAGASRKHNLIVVNIIASLGYQLKNKPCRVYPSDMRLKIEKTGLYTYPDVMVVCGEEKFGDEKQDTLLNPDIIIEVLSDSTEKYDRGTKFKNYRQIESLKEYVMIAQNAKSMERYFRDEKGQWVLTETDDNNPFIDLKISGCRLEIDEVYDKA
ncbi:DUF820 [Desulfonema limicola]|uniref:DUF820 n=1 Tax=Desulfonema limicola TaxID=45656 RepID=A0A975GJJ5_9BACT|nr:Uma2 family endonuclease [Desulfonema limicola]QTA83487.1 DUF820 [Desulfonema limicola]